jgi:hypothetical protein
LRVWFGEELEVEDRELREIISESGNERVGE